MKGNRQSHTPHSPGIMIISALDHWSLGPGKGGPALSRTITGYLERGWRVYFLTSNRSEAGFSQLPCLTELRYDAPILKRLFGVRPVGFLAKTLFWAWFQVLTMVNALSVGRGSVDIVYGYEIHGVPIAKLLSWLWGIPLVTRFQGTTMTKWMGRPFWRLRAWQHVVALRASADLVIMTDDGTQGDQVLRRLKADMSHVEFWMNGVDWERFDNLPTTSQARAWLGIPDVPVILTVSRLVGWKRVDRTLGVLPSLVEEIPAVLLLVVGDGPEKDRLADMAQRLGVTEHVRFVGAVSHEQIPTYLMAADVFVSLYDLSNVGNPLLEAMMAGRCIVTLDNGDTHRYVEDGKTGILMNPDDLSGLAKTLRTLLRDEAHRRRLGDAAREYARASFSSWEDRIAREVEQVRALLISEPGEARDA